MSIRQNSPKKSSSLRPPTPSEAAFERALSTVLGQVGRDTGGSNQSVAAFVADVFSRGREFLEREPFAGIGDAQSFYTKVVGVSFEGRQDVVVGLIDGQELELVRQPDNPKDANAIAVRNGILHVGFVRAQIAKQIAPAIDAGVAYRARVASLTGGGSDIKHRGVNLYVWRPAARTSNSQAQAARERWSGDAPRVREALIGGSRPHDAQQEVLDRVEAGKNTLAVLGTGRGKSFCFQYPAVLRALESEQKTLAIYPLRALANDQYEGLKRKLDPLGLRILRANGSIAPDERDELFAALSDGAWDIILATPEFLEYHRDAFGERSHPSLVVVDEAHHLFESKHRPAYGKLGRTIASLGKVQVLALTATADDEAFAQIVNELRIESWVIDPTVRENLRVIDARNHKDKFGYLGDLATDAGDGKTIVYCMSRPEAQKAAEALRKRLGDVVMFYHAGMPTADRLQVEALFREGALKVVVATSAFGEGIDLPDVRNVVLYHLNFDFTSFNQQAGRAGRDGAPAEIHLLFGDADRRINDFIIDRSAPTLGVLRELYRGMRALAHDGVLHMAHTDVARTLELDKADERTVAAAIRIFADAGLIETGVDDDGRFARFLPVDGKVDLTQNERFAEGEAEREAFARFADFALTARPEALERIVNRPIYPQRVDLKR
jgi:single-stranded-DNA-specific exonuclease